MLSLAGILLVLASGQGADAAASPVSVVATASKAEVSVGEAFTIELKATGPAGTAYTFAGEASAEQLELRTPPPVKEAKAPEPGTHRYEAQVFALGELQVPGIPVRYRLADGSEGEAASGPIALKVVSLLPKDESEQTLADIRGPASVGVGRAFWVALAAVVLALGALAYYLLRRRRKAEGPAEARVPEVAPDVEALGAIDALARDGLPARGELRLFYIRLSTILKRYLERRLGAPVLEMTSAETLAFLRAHAHGPSLLPVVRDVAEAADRIKFAKGHGASAEAERHLAAVRALVPALEARLAPKPAEAEGKAA
jgi:predicted secreted protein